MKTGSKIILGLVAVVVIAVGAAAVTVMNFDINKYRGQLAELLSKQTGRTVSLNGPIKLEVSSRGVSVVVQDAFISNPSWASRPNMAGVGKLELGVALMPLLDKQLVITALDIANADIELESNASGQNNWDMKPAAAQNAAGKKVTPESKAAGAPVGISVQELSVKDSQLAMRDKTGKVSVYKISSASVKPGAGGTAVEFAGEANGAPVKLTVTAGTANIITAKKFPFDADATYNQFHVQAKGDADLTKKTYQVDTYKLTAGGTTLQGKLIANLSGTRPSLRGDLTSEKIDPADFQPRKAVSAAAEKGEAAPAAASAAPGGRMFSDAPLDLAALRSADVDMNVTIGEIPAGKMALRNLSTKLTLTDGHLSVPFKAALGNNPLEGDLKLTAATPAQYNLALRVPGADLGDLLHGIGAPAVLTGGKGNADIQLSGSGSTAHELASRSNGHIDVTAEGGEVSSAAASGIGAGLMQILSPGGGNPILTCLAARFVVENGVARDNGLLADSSASTVAGVGGFNLGEETIDLTLRAKPKLAKAAGLVPPLRISGALTKPALGLDALGTAQTVAGLLGKSKLFGNAAGDSGVPELLAAPAGQNACLYTLDHKPATAAAPQNNAVQNAAGQATQKAKDLGNQLMKGLFGR